VSFQYPVYVVDDDPLMREWLVLILEEEGLASRAFASGSDFLSDSDALDAGCILLDMRMPRKNGLQVQAELAERGCNMPVIAMTGFGTVEVAVQSMKLGSMDLLEKPFDRDTLMTALKQAFARLDSSHAAS
jgi:two-component system response regulator FixJ